MKRSLLVATVISTFVIANRSVTAQDSRSEATARAVAVLEAQLASGQAIQLSGQTLTLTGDTLRVSGRASFQLNDTWIRADGAVVHLATKRVDLTGQVMSFLGPETSKGLGLRAPSIDYR
jgi:hypothetical protein